MPGLVGYINNKNNTSNSSLIENMCAALKHHEWYQTDKYTNAGMGLALARVHLGIVNNAPQPYVSPDNKVKIFMHGEIYNEDSDDSNQLEYVYRQYQQFGKDFVLKLNGSFIIIIIDEVKDTIIITNDRTASKPLFYYANGLTIYLAPEIKALLTIPSFERKINQAALADFLACGHLLNGETLVEGIRVLDNASIIEVTNKGIATSKYWQLTFHEITEDKGFEYYQQILAELMRSAVKRHTRTQHKYGILLSGGYDSRGILGCYIEEKGMNNVHTISWGNKENIPRSDCLVSRKLTDELGTKHTFFELKPQELNDNLYKFIFLHDGLTDSFTNYPESLKIFQNIRDEEHIQVILRGDQCYGYSGNAVTFDERSLFKSLGIYIFNEIMKYKMIIKPAYLDAFSKLNSNTIKAISSKCDAKDLDNRGWFFYLDLRHKYYLNCLNYVKSIELESRNPWVDNQIIDFMSTVPSKYRLSKYLYHKTLEKMFPELFKEIARKQNAIDWAYEFRNSSKLKEFIYRELIEKSNVFDEFINKEGLKTELDRFFYNKNPGSLRSKIKTMVTPILLRIPAVYRLVRKWSYRLSSEVPMDTIIARLLTLKIWCEIFMKPDKQNNVYS